MNRTDEKIVLLVIILIIFNLGSFYLGSSFTNSNNPTVITSTQTATSFQTSRTSITVTSSYSRTVTSNQTITSSAFSVSTVISGLTQPVPVGAYYYAWYGLPGDTHWNNSACTVTLDMPTQGHYDSLNSSLVKWQIQQASGAGLSFFIVSWWGPSNDNTTDYGKINYAVQNFFKVLSSLHTNFKAAIMVDGYNSSLDYSGYLNVYNYVYANFVQPYRSNYVYLDGKPLLTVFNTPNPESEHPPSTNLFTIETVGNAPSPVDWYLWSAGNITHPATGMKVISTQQNFNPTISADGYVSVTPRFDDSLLYNSHCRSGSLVLDQNYTLGLYQNQWNYVLGHKSSVSLVVINSWNEYFERSFIEPAVSYTNPTQNPYNLLDVTQAFVQELESTSG